MGVSRFRGIEIYTDVEKYIFHDGDFKVFFTENLLEYVKVWYCQNNNDEYFVS